MLDEYTVEGISTTIPFFRAVVRDEEFRRGDFSRAATIVYNPFTGNPDGSGRQPFAGNVIPPNMISPIASAILALIPAPNIPGAALGQINYELPYQRKKTTDAFDVKINRQLSDRDAVSARFRSGDRKAVDASRRQRSLRPHAD